jgi:hypothetical protein
MELYGNSARAQNEARAKIVQKHLEREREYQGCDPAKCKNFNSSQSAMKDLSADQVMELNVLSLLNNSNPDAAQQAVRESMGDKAADLLVHAVCCAKVEGLEGKLADENGIVTAFAFQPENKRGKRGLNYNDFKKNMMEDFKFMTMGVPPEGFPTLDKTSPPKADNETTAPKAHEALSLVAQKADKAKQGHKMHQKDGKNEEECYVFSYPLTTETTSGTVVDSHNSAKYRICLKHIKTGWKFSSFDECPVGSKACAF